MPERRLTGRQITTMVVAACIAIIAFPVGSFAASALTSTTVTDAQTGAHAHVTSWGAVYVSDGAGPLTVDGTVRTAAADTTVNVFTGSLSPSTRSFVTLNTSAYRTIRISVFNHQASAAPLYIYSQITSSSDASTIHSYLVDGSIPNTTHQTYTFDVPGPYTTIATFGGTFDVQLFGRP